MKRDVTKFLLIFVIVAFLALLAAVVLPGRRPPSTEPLPNPNGYEAFVKAADRLAGSFADAHVATPEELAILIARNTNSLQTARTGLQQKSRVPLEFSQSDITNH